MLLINLYYLNKLFGDYKMVEIKYVPTICPYCGTGCGLNFVVKDDKIVGVEPVGIIVEMNGSINEYEHVDEIKPNLEFIIKNPKYFKPQIKVNTSLVSLKEFEKLNYQMSEIFDDIEYYDENDADISYSAEDMIKKLSGSN